MKRWKKGIDRISHQPPDIFFSFSGRLGAGCPRSAFPSCGAADIVLFERLSQRLKSLLISQWQYSLSVHILSINNKLIRSHSDLFSRPRRQGQFFGSLYLSMMSSDKMTHKRHHILCLLMERWKKVSDISQPPISSTAAAAAQLPHCYSWWPTAPCCLGVTAPKTPRLGGLGNLLLFKVFNTTVSSMYM